MNQSLDYIVTSLTRRGMDSLRKLPINLLNIKNKLLRWVPMKKDTTDRWFRDSKKMFYRIKYFLKFTEKSLKIYSLLSYTAWTPYLIVLRVEKKKERRSVQYYPKTNRKSIQTITEKRLEKINVPWRNQCRGLSPWSTADTYRGDIYEWSRRDWLYYDSKED